MELARLIPLETDTIVLEAHCHHCFQVRLALALLILVKLAHLFPSDTGAIIPK